MADYIPAADANFENWQENFLSVLSNNLEPLALLPSDIAAMVAAQTVWSGAYGSHLTAQNAAKGATQTKDTARDTLEEEIRPFVQRLQTSPLLTDAQRAAMGITVPDPVRSPAPQPTSRPIVSIDTSERLRHSVTFFDEQTPTTRAKPEGVMGAEIWLSTGGAPPVSLSEMSFAALATRSPHLVEHASQHAGQAAHYWVRWVSTRGEVGPWSETASATIGA